jgi:ribosomal subunit interface protein
MLIAFRTKGFEVEPLTKRYVESRLRSEIGEFQIRVDSVAVSLDASRGRTDSDGAVSEIAVHLRPSGGVRSRAEDADMRVAVDRAIAHVRAQLERELARIPRTVVSPQESDQSHDHALDILLDENRISVHHRELLERPENYLRPLRVRER